MMSELKTKKKLQELSPPFVFASSMLDKESLLLLLVGIGARIRSRASLIGPAVPNGSSS